MKDIEMVLAALIGISFAAIIVICFEILQLMFCFIKKITKQSRGIIMKKLNDFSEEQIKETLKSLIDSTDYYELNFTGGTHIIFEDGNCRMSDVEFCKEESIKCENLNCYLICCLLEKLGTDEKIEEFVNDESNYL